MAKKASEPPRTIAVLHLTVPMPDFGFFQAVKVKTTKEVGTIVGMWYAQTEDASHQWLYRIDGLSRLGMNWWQADQIRSLHRRSRQQESAASDG